MDEAIKDLERLRRSINRGTSLQVSSSAEKNLIQATAYAWFKSHRPNLTTRSDEPELNYVDAGFRELLDATGRSTTRSRYKKVAGDLRKDLVALRSELIQDPALLDGSAAIVDECPDFSPLVSDSAMRNILTRRWAETSLCLQSGANLASVVMMGALLEALLLSRVNHVPDLAPIFRSGAVPKDKSGKPIQLKDWTLRHYIDVAHDQGWIRQSARDVGVVIRDYRNYIHPAKELSHGVTLDENDASVLWVVFKSIADQVIRSV
ncbi:MAG: hypothetical protein NXI30_02155 [bacterium]|nr:hypothetical protein [bacterium]